MIDYGWREGALRGDVGLSWERAERPRWDFDATVRRTIAEDQRLAASGQNPAPAFRKHRLRADHDEIDKWVRGCKFPWLQ